MKTDAARSALEASLRVKNGPEVRSSSAIVARMLLAQASSWPSGLVPAHVGKLTCAENLRGDLCLCCLSSRYIL